MACKDLYSSIKIDNAKTIDTQGFNSVTFAVVTTAASKITLQEGDIESKLTDVALEDYLGEPLDIKNGGLYKIGYRGNKRYVGIKATGDATAIAILGHPNKMPIE